MSKMLIVINGFFNFTWLMQQKIICMVEKRHTSPKLINIINRIKVISLISFIFLIIVYILFPQKSFIITIIFILMLIYLCCLLFPTIEKPFISAFSFITKGIIIIIVCALFLSLIIIKCINFNSIGFFILLFLFWLLFSLLANNKVSTVVNGSVSALLALLTIIFNYFYDLLPKDYIIIDNQSITELCTQYSCTQIEALRAAFTTLIFPLLIVNTLTTLFCLLKGYWIQKYNDGNDISEGMIRQKIAVNLRRK